MLARKALAHDALDTRAYGGVVAITRHEDETRIKALVRIASDEQSHLVTFVQVDDAAHGSDQIAGVGLKQFVARVGFECIDERFRIVTIARQTEVSNHLCDLAPQ